MTTGSFTVTWRVDPATSPQPWRHCPTCGRTRAFRSSGRIRLNANGRRLDAWLIYRCETCARSWNLPLLERVPVEAVPRADLQAMQANLSGWVKAEEFNLARLQRYCDRVELSDQVAVRQMACDRLPEGVSVVRIVLEARLPIGERLDRLLSRELRLSRSRLQDLVSAGVLSLEAASARVWRKPLGAGAVVRLDLDRLDHGERVELEGRLRAVPDRAG